MPVLPENVRSPEGHIVDAMFPGIDTDDIDTRIQVWITQAETQLASLDLGLEASEEDAAVRAWVYYRAFSARAVELASMPSSISIPNEESTTRTADQRALFERLADEWLDSYQGIVVVEYEDSGSVVPPTGSSKTIVKM